MDEIEKIILEVLHKNEGNDMIDSHSFNKVAAQAAFEIKRTHKVEKLETSEAKGMACPHKNTYFVSGLFGGTWCHDCDRKIDK